MTVDERFMSKVEKSADDCWIWHGTMASMGYGVFFDSPARPRVYAHRWAFERWVEPITDRHYVLHHCDVMVCVNPTHLFQGTQADNMADAWRKGRTAHGTRLPQAKLTEAQVQAIRDAPGYRGVNVALAAQYGVGDSQICVIRSGKSWKWLRKGHAGRHKELATDGRVLASW